MSSGNVTPAMRAELRARVEAVIRARASDDEARRQYNEAFAVWEEAHRGLVEARQAAQESRQAAEFLLRGLTLGVYRDTGDKAPFPGVGIREMTRVDYPYEEALAWAMEHKICLQLDVKAFERTVQLTGMRPPFVRAKTEAQATIGTKLEIEAE